MATSKEHAPLPVVTGGDAMPEWNPETGGFDVPGAAPLKQSWNVGTRSPGTYEDSFEYQGATVYFNGMLPDEMAQFQAQEKKISDEAQAFDKEVNRRVTLEQSRAKAKVKPSIEEAEKLQEESAQIAEGWKVRREKIFSDTLALLTSAITKTVVGWIDAPIPFEPDAVYKLPPAIILAWAPNIIENSRLTGKEAAFLAPK